MGDGTSSDEIERALKGVHRFRGVYSSNDMPNPLTVPADSCLIANYGKTSQPGTHWIAILHLNDVSQPPAYFDPFGFSPDDLNQLIHQDAHFKSYMDKAAKRFHGRYATNDFNLQGATTDDCGEYCVYAVLVNRLPLDSNGKVDPRWRQIIDHVNGSSANHDRRLMSLVKIRGPVPRVPKAYPS